MGFLRSSGSIFCGWWILNDWFGGFLLLPSDLSGETRRSASRCDRPCWARHGAASAEPAREHGAERMVSGFFGGDQGTHKDLISLVTVSHHTSIRVCSAILVVPGMSVRRPNVHGAPSAIVGGCSHSG